MRAGKAQGSICDRCKKSLGPFDRIKIITIIHKKGPRYEKVSSDITQETKDSIDLCKDCYRDYLKKMINWTNNI